ncbi:MAG: hypothetical protein ACLFPQ_01085 [Candidatus Woesearchaeota archaeon]
MAKKNTKQLKKEEKSRKAQAEVFGLLFIVMLISVALVLVIKSELDNRPTEIRQSYQKSELASNTINAIINTRTRDCNDLDIGDLLVDCAKNPDDPRINCENGESSCLYASQTINLILEDTLRVWNRKYFINMSVNGDMIPDLMFASSDQQSVDDLCPMQERKVDRHPLPLYPNTLVIETWICN